MATFFNLLWQVPTFIIFIAALFEFIGNQQPNLCEMTYMFENPEYTRVWLSSEIERNYSQYGLYIYGEGSFAERHRVSLESLDGFPVLFIPGNAGSHKQVRSLGSVSLRLGIHRQLHEHFDYFSIDFDESLYAFYGGDIEKQTAYLHHCVKHILSLYKKPGHIPTSVILVGHSMGGMLARALFTLPDFDKKTVNLIYTQATPHQSPVAYTDYLPDFYRKVNVYWLQERDLDLAHITIVSTGDGSRDLLVNYHLTLLDDLVIPTRALSANTMSVPKAWLSTDHLCAVWCKQMVMNTVRSMYNLIDPKTKQLTTDLGKRQRVLQHHFLRHSGSDKAVLDKPRVNVSFDEQFEWDSLVDLDHIILDKYTAQMDKYFSFIVEKHHDMFVAEISLTGQSWIFGCKAKWHDDSCTHGDDLTLQASILPHAKETRRLIQLGEGILHQYDRIVFHIRKTPPKHYVYLNARLITKKGKLHTVYHAPRVGDLILDFPRSIYHHTDVVINKTKLGESYRLVTIPTLTDMYQSYTAHLDILSCRDNQALTSYMKLHLPWSKGTDLWAATKPSEGRGNLSLQLMVPVTQEVRSSAELHLYLQPNCQYRLSVSLDFPGAFSRIARYYFHYLPSFVTANLFMVLCHQLFTVSKGLFCPSIAQAQDSYGQPWKLALGASVLEMLFSYSSIREWIANSGLPATDGSILEMKGLYFPFMHLLLYSLAFIAVRILANITHYALVILGNIMRVLFHKVFTHHTIPSIGSLMWWCVLVSGIYSSWNYSGSVGLLVTLTLILADIMASYVTYPSDDRRHSMWLLQQTLLLLTFTTFILTLPEFVTWFKHLKYSSYLAHDPSRYPSIVIATSFMLVRFNTEHENWYTSWLYSCSPVVLSMLALIYGTVNIWRLNVIIPTVFVWVASIQSLGILVHRQKSSHRIVRDKIENISHKSSPRDRAPKDVDNGDISDGSNTDDE